MYVILLYDITIDDGGPRVLRNVFKIAKRYLSHIQNSVFEGELDSAQLLALKHELNQWLRADDSCIIFRSRSPKWLDKEFLTEYKDQTSNFV
ncbi:MAG: CRISPR-associated endonuclease Cas2 [Clostridia bacterium]|nr:CRISPR-associated endonuclease Cas2 [Clostridia bacterium]